MFLPQLHSLNLVPSAHVSGRGTGQVFLSATAFPMPGALSCLCSEPSVCEQLLLMLIVEAREHCQSLGNSGHVGRQGPPTWELCSSQLCPGGRRWSDCLPQPNFPSLCSSSQQPETHFRQPEIHPNEPPPNPLSSPSAALPAAVKRA